MERAGEDKGGRAGSRTTSQAKWTFMVYMAGDNNLDGAALRDIAEMAQAGSTKDINILVQLDRLEDNLTRRFRITRDGGFRKDCIESFGDTNTGDPQILYDLVKWAADNHPADRYTLILWNPAAAGGRMPRAEQPVPQRRNRAGAFSGNPSRRNTSTVPPPRNTAASAKTTPPAATPWTIAS